jgi:hypothetical protein
LAPEEDSGSDTLGRYRYQAEVAARDCLAMLTQVAIDFVVCEWQEDFVVAWTDGSVDWCRSSIAKGRGPMDAP